MRGRQIPDVSTRLEKANQRFEHWRQTQQGRSRIPEPLWAAAVRAAEQCGPFRTAQILRLDYASLKRRMEAAATRKRRLDIATACRRSGEAMSRVPSGRRVGHASGGLSGGAVAPTDGKEVPTGREAVPTGREAVPTFLELTPPGAACLAEYILELEDARGAKMRVHLKGVDMPDWAALCRDFWSTER